MKIQGRQLLLRVFATAVLIGSLWVVVGGGMVECPRIGQNAPKLPVGTRLEAEPPASHGYYSTFPATRLQKVRWGARKQSQPKCLGVYSREQEQRSWIIMSTGGKGDYENDREGCAVGLLTDGQRHIVRRHF